MKAIYFLALMFGSALALANPTTDGSNGACVSACEQVFTDCTVQCEETKADAHERHFDTPDLPVADCLADCEEDLKLCKSDC